MAQQRNKKEIARAEARMQAQLSGEAKALKRSIQGKKKKVLKKQMGQGTAKLTNPYLQTLVDPERFSGVRYPDAFPRLTGTCQGLLNEEMFVFPTQAAPSTDAASEVAGTFLNIVTPTMLDPVLQYRQDILAGTGGGAPDVVARSYLVNASEQYGFVAISEDASCMQSATNQLFLKEVDKVNVKMPLTYSDQDFPQPLSRGFDPNGDVFYGYPFRYQNTASGAIEVTVGYEPGIAAAPSVSLFAELVTTKGVSSLAMTTTIATGSTVATGVATFINTQLNPLCVTGTASCTASLPGIGLRLQAVAPSPNGKGYCIRYIQLRWLRGTVTAPIARFATLKFPDEDIYTRSIDQYRVVSASAWVEYEGADLTNGGQIAAIMYRGGRSGTENGLWQYSLVAETPGGYQGALKLGSYSFWMASNDRDMLFRDLDITDRWQLPYIMNVGLVASPDLPHTLRLRVPMNFEFVSTAQFYQYKHADIAPEMITHAASVVSQMNTSMENPLHWATIKEYLAKAANTAWNVGSWVGRNWGVIAPAATAIGAALL